MAGTSRAAGSGLTCPLVRHTSFPGRTGNLLALVMNQKSGNIVLNTLKIKYVEFFPFFSGEYLPLFHASAINTQFFRNIIQGLNCSGLENIVIKSKLMKLRI